MKHFLIFLPDHLEVYVRTYVIRQENKHTAVLNSFKPLESLTDCRTLETLTLVAIVVLDASKEHN